MIANTVTAKVDEVSLPPVPRCWSGDALRAAREQTQLSVQELSERTRIRAGLITAIETEDFYGLPARPFLRGLLIQIARRLRLPEEDVADGYLHRRSELAQ